MPTPKPKFPLSATVWFPGFGGGHTAHTHTLTGTTAILRERFNVFEITPKDVPRHCLNVIRYRSSERFQCIHTTQFNCLEQDAPLHAWRVVPLPRTASEDNGHNHDCPSVL